MLWVAHRMKKLLLPAIALCLFSPAVLAGNWFGSGPWANATYYPGNLDGKYQAAVFGANVSGVLGFAIRDGAPPFLQSQSQTLASLNSGGSNNAIVSNQQIGIDPSLNYYAIFVNGRTYVGTTAGAINYDNSTVAGTLIGTQPSTLTTTNKQITSQILTNISTTLVTNTSNSITVTSQLFTNVTTTNQSVIVTNNGVVTRTNIVFNQTNVQTLFITNTNTVNLPPTPATNITTETVLFTNDLINATIVQRGVDGAFQASINSKRAVFTFQGPGQLTAPGVVTNGSQVNPALAFNVNGIRVSFSSTANFQSLTPANGAAAQ
jgi:hypothetical protein